MVDESYVKDIEAEKKYYHTFALTFEDHKGDVPAEFASQIFDGSHFLDFERPNSRSHGQPSALMMTSFDHFRYTMAFEATREFGKSVSGGKFGNGQRFNALVMNNGSLTSHLAEIEKALVVPHYDSTYAANVTGDNAKCRPGRSFRA